MIELAVDDLMVDLVWSFNFKSPVETYFTWAFEITVNQAW